MIRLQVRCLNVRDGSDFFPDDIYEVIKLTFKDKLNGNITILNSDGRKVYKKIKVVHSKDISIGCTLFRLRAVPTTLTVSDTV